MTNPVDHEAARAAQILCMLAQDTHQQNVDLDQTEDEDDCVITHVRPVVRRHPPVVQRHHPYRRPEPQRVGVPAARSRGMSPNVEAERMAREREFLHRDNWNVFPLEEHEMHPGAPVPEVRRVVRNGVAVLEKVPLPRMQPLDVPLPTPVQCPTPPFRPLPDRRPSPVEQPNLQATPDRHSLPDRRPSPPQPPSHNENDACPVYSIRSLALQALLAAPQGWMSMHEVADYLEGQYPYLREHKLSVGLRPKLSTALTQAEILEKSDAQTPVRWRLPAGARHTAAKLAWKPSRLASPLVQHLDTQGQAFPTTRYTPQSLILQALLSAPEGQSMNVYDLMDYLCTQYPQLREVHRRAFSQRMQRALYQSQHLVERSVQPQPKMRVSVYWRLRPGVREEATRSAWDRSE